MSYITPVTAVPSDKTLVITRRTVKVGDHVYPLGNICHFGPGTRLKKILPWRVLCVVAFIGLFLAAFDSTRLIGSVFVIAAAAAFIYDQTKGRRFGLMLTLNSGRELFFETTDNTGIAAVANHVYTMLEHVDQDREPKQVTVNHHKVTIQDTTITGALNTGTVHGDMDTDTGARGLK